MSNEIETDFECKGLKVIKLKAPEVSKNRLLITECSGEKIQSIDPIEAFQCYDGKIFKIIKNFFRDNGRPDNLMIYILSAKYGLIPEKLPILPYDMKLNKNMAVTMNAETIELLKKIQPVPDEIYINLSKKYMPAITGIKEVFPNAIFVYPEFGDIGFRQRDLKAWLKSINYKPEQDNTKKNGGYMKIKLLKKNDSKIVEVEATESGDKHTALCPFHDDTKPSLSIDLNKGVFFCHACEATGQTVEAIYDYLDENGKPIYQVIKGIPKSFYVI